MSKEPRSSADVIAELRETVGGMLPKSFAVLVVGYEKGKENHAQFVLHDDPDALARVNAHIQAGAELFGFVIVERTGPTTGKVKVRPLLEQGDDEWVETMLINLGARFRDSFNRGGTSLD
jgi:hypothetical protein